MASSLLLHPRAVRLAASPLYPHNAANPRNAVHSSLTQRPVVRPAACARSRSIVPISASKPSTQLSALCPAAGLPDLRLRSRSSAKRSSAENQRSAQRLVVSASAAAAAAPAPAESEKPKFTWAGAVPIPFVISVGVGLAVRFLVPVPAGVTAQAWQLLAIFLSTITGLVLGPLPVGAWAFVCLTFTVLSKTLSFAAAFSAMTNEVIWLIVISFFFARGFVKTGLGDRVATYFVKWFGKSTLGLSYGLAVSEALISPTMPSTTARAGGVFLPIISSLARSFNSLPNDPSSKKLGRFLIMSQFQASANASAMYLTGGAQNLLCIKLAQELGVVIPNVWATWFKLAAIPGLIGLLVTPLLLFNLYPPELKDTPEAPGLAEVKLKEMGPVTPNELIMVFTMLLAVSLWVLGDSIGIPSVVAAMIALCVLLLSGVLSWNDCLSEKSAWDTLAWFAVLIGMSAQLNAMGIVQWMADNVASGLTGAGGSWVGNFFKLQAMYFGSHYLFASQTGHVGALYSAFLAMQLAAGVPGVLAALALALNTNLFGSITHYSSGQAALYYGAGYIDLPDVFKFGAITAAVNIVIWIAVCAFWWKVNGLF
ncbi:hypothetical protein CLOM_g4586 [Closterium sp. NIES-68]|nr:hypothetical protein CLOM_g4586 [Closterium sp. NIES-68]GJP74907.1 hypothetical protein CLOP_g5430 [Closterium sp. NIES-67]